ncbi:MAG: glyoxalase [Pseudonocardiaceae bacterium]|nr:glyoxalase [Pseudonocardiaceae bacterium]
MTEQMIFVNLPVQDLQRSRDFWTDLGYSFNPTFSDDNCGCLVFSDSIYAMLLVTDFFKTFTSKEIVDANTATEALLCLSAQSRDAVDSLVDRAVGAGGKEPRPAMQEEGMYGRAFEDPDGHIWEILWMDPGAVQG